MTGRSSRATRSTSSGTGPRARKSSTPLSRETALVSVRVLGADNRGNGGAFAKGLEWAVEASGASVVNLSLSSRSDAYLGLLHELADLAYFRNVLLVCAANNVSVAAHPSSQPSSRSPPTTCRAPEPRSATRSRQWSWSLRAERGRRLARRDADGGHGQQLCRAPHRRLCGADPERPSGPHAIRDEVDPGGHRGQRKVGGRN